MTFLLRLFLLIAGLLFAASLAVAGTLMVALWGVRAIWAKLTGRPMTPFVVRIHPRRAFDQVYPRPGATGRRHVPVGDVTDVEPKH